MVVFVKLAKLIINNRTVMWASQVESPGAVILEAGLTICAPF